MRNFHATIAFGISTAKEGGEENKRRTGGRGVLVVEEGLNGVILIDFRYVMIAFRFSGVKELRVRIYGLGNCVLLLS